MMCSQSADAFFEKKKVVCLCCCCVKPSSACLLPPIEFQPKPHILQISTILTLSLLFYSLIRRLSSSSSLDPSLFILVEAQFSSVCSANLSRFSVDRVQHCTQTFDPSPTPSPIFSRPVIAPFEAIATFTPQQRVLVLTGPTVAKRCRIN